MEKSSIRAMYGVDPIQAKRESTSQRTHGVNKREMGVDLATRFGSKEERKRERIREKTETESGVLRVSPPPPWLKQQKKKSVNRS